MLLGIETAHPPFKVDQITAAEKLKQRMATRPAIARLIDAAAQHSGIDSRYIVIPDADDDTTNHFYAVSVNGIAPDTKSRMLEYKKWASELSISAVEKLLASTGISADKINKLITISCTGFYAPGLDYDLIKHLGLKKDIKRTNIGFMGCAASLVGFNTVLDALNSDEDSDILMISVELCSLHLQTEPTRDNILANMIFADGAAAALFTNRNHEPNKLRIIKTHSMLFENSSSVMGWEIGNTGFLMNLSSDLPKLISEFAVPQIIKFLKDNEISIDEINYWALHPGGRAILDALQNGLCLSEEKMKHSREVLREYGNLSSASILFVLNNLLQNQKIEKDQLCCAVAFGPGLTMEVVILKGT